jgi:tetratricopeptide (TPR) repeat protein
MEGRQAVALAPTDPNRHSDLAGIVQRAGRHSEALDITARGLSLNPSHLPSLHCRARALVSLGRVDEAQELMDAAFLDDPDLAALRTSIAGVLESEGHRGRAADEYRAALRLDKSVDVARHGLRRVDPPYRRLLPTNWRRKRG